MTRSWIAIVLLGLACGPKHNSTRSAPDRYELEVTAAILGKRPIKRNYEPVVGSRVQARWTDGFWYFGRVTAMRGAAPEIKVDITFEDGGNLTNLPRTHVKTRVAEFLVDCKHVSDPVLVAFCRVDCGAISNPDVRAFCDGKCTDIKHADYREFCATHQTLPANAVPTVGVEYCKKIVDADVSQLCTAFVDNRIVEWERRRATEAAPVAEEATPAKTCIPNGAKTDDYSGGACCSNNARALPARENITPDWVCCEFGTHGCP